MSSKSRPELIESLMKAMRDQAGRGLMLHGAIAERFGLNFTDLKCLDLARSEPELTAGRIAAVTGLSTSAVTAVLGDYGDEQLTLLLEVVQRMNRAAEQAAARITADTRN
ncbi:hypothetical protein ABZ543_07410 [Streptomyces roseifaciens]